MKRYVKLQCSVCNRQKNVLWDSIRAVPDRCTITLRCRGRLYEVERLNNIDIATTPVAGVEDWYARGTLVQPVLAVGDEWISTATGQMKQLVIGVKSPTSPTSAATLTLPLNLRTSTNKTYRQYVYRQEGSITTVAGVESGTAKKVLRYTSTGPSPDVVEVYVNGIKREQGTGADEFQLYDGTPSTPAPPNTIVFNTVISSPGVTQVDVIVSRPVAQDTTNLVLQRVVHNEHRVGTGAWENVNFIKINGEAYYLFYVDIIGTNQLTLNTMLYPRGATATLTDAGPTSFPAWTDLVLLYANSPYTYMDRALHSATFMSEIDGSEDVLHFLKVDDVQELRITATAEKAVYPPITATTFTFDKYLPATSGDDAVPVHPAGPVIGPHV
jgi:hypothetical protein